MKQVLTRILRNRWVLTAAGLVALYAACGFLLAPYLVARDVPRFAHERLERQASVGKVRINPFLLTLEADDFRLAEANGSPIASARRLYVDLDAASVLHWAWVFSDIAVDGLDLHVVTDPDGQTNLAKLADALRGPKPAADPAGAPPRMLFRHVELTHGSLTYTDRAQSGPASATLAPIDIRLDEVATLPDRTGKYAIQARLPGGGTMAWRGSLSLRPLASQGELAISGLKPAAIWKFLQGDFRLEPPEGEVKAQTSYRFDVSGGWPQLVLTGGRLGVADLALHLTGEAQPLLALQRIEASGIGLDLQRRAVTVSNLAVAQGEARASIAADGTLDWQRIAPARAKPAPPSASPWRVNFDAIDVAGVGARVADVSRAAPVTLEVGSIALQAAAQLELGGTTTSFSSSALHAGLSEVALKRDGAPLVALEKVTLGNATIDTAKREVALHELAVRGGNATLTRDAQGRIDLLSELSARRSGGAPGAKSTPWRFGLEAFTLGDFRVALADRSVEPPVRYDLTGVSAELTNLSSDLHARVPFEVSLRVAQGGELGATGSFAPDGSGAEVRLKLARLKLVPLQPLVARFASVNLKSGELSAEAMLQYQPGNSNGALRADGSVSLAGLRMTEAPSGQRLLACKALEAQGVRFALSPDQLTVKEVNLVRPDARLIVFKDHSFNLAKLLKTEGAARKRASAPSRAFPVRVGRVRVEDGTVDYADESLVLPFAAHVEALGGSVAGISSKVWSQAEVALEGRVGEYGLARVRGALSPFAPKRFTDLRVVFRNVDMPPLSPYTATFAGRKIASGRLDLNLRYRIQDGQLEGDNQILLDHFTLGERVEAPNALHLPLDLAIALLTDSQGRIDVAVPVQGDVSSPKFSYGHLIWQAIATVIEKVVTAPFRALGALLGGGAEKFGAIAFDPGSERVLPPELEKLKKVGEALAKRPQLQVSVEGRYDPALDGRALRGQMVRRELAAAQGVKLRPGEEPGPVAFDEARTQLALENLLRARAGGKAMTDFVAQFEKREGRKPERVNPLLGRLGKASPDRAFYQALYPRLVELQPLPDSQLTQLAQERASAVAHALVQEAGVQPARVSIGKTEAVSESGRHTVETRLVLGVVRTAAQ